MIDRTIEWCLKNSFLVLAFFILILFISCWALTHTPVDAIPDIGVNQQVLFVDWPGRSPKDIEDQVVYPLTTNLLGIPKVEAIRSNSMFGFGMINIIFEDGVDFYWSRTRILERLSFAQKDLPTGVVPVLGPDATALGQVFWYTVENGYYCPDHLKDTYDSPGICPKDGRSLMRSKYNLAELRSLQDWFIRFQIQSCKGVSEVASIGGYVKQYQVDVDPNKLLAYHIALKDVITAVKKSNIDVGAKVIEEGGSEWIVRGLGFIKKVEDVENIVVGASGGIPIYIKNVGQVSLGPDFRRGALDKDGFESVGGIVLMRYGENPLKVIDAVRQKIEEIGIGLPPGVSILPYYDRSHLIHRSINTLKWALIMAVCITVGVVLTFMGQVIPSLIISVILPMGILMCFLLMYGLRVSSNIMSLGGIAIAIGIMVDAGVIMTEGISRHLAAEERKKSRFDIVLSAAKQVGPPIFFSILIIITAYLTIFTLRGESGRLFKPLAFTTVSAMSSAALLSITLVPVLCLLMLRGKMRPPEKNILGRILIKLYRPVLGFILSHKLLVIFIALLILLASLYPILGVGIITRPLRLVVNLQKVPRINNFVNQLENRFPGIRSEFMPPLNEGDLLYMPVTLPGTSLTQIMQVMQTQDRIIKTLPEVKTVVGKLGRAETATDPAPVSMIESMVILKPREEWRSGMTRQKLIGEIIQNTQVPGFSPIMTQPIRNRIDMLATGIQTPIGIKVFGADLKRIEQLAIEIESLLKKLPGALNPYAERVGNKPYLEIEIDREQVARYGIRLGDVQDIIMTGIGGMNVTTTVEGRERYPVRVRYMRELRDNVEALKRVLVDTPYGANIPLEQLTRIHRVPGPAKVASENTMLYIRIFVDVDTEVTGIVDFVRMAREAIHENIKFPPGYFITWSGQYEYELQSRKQLMIVVPMCLAIIFMLLYIKFKSFPGALVLFLALPFAFVGGIWLQYLAGYRFSTAVWVGYIALFGICVEDGVVMVDYLLQALKKEGGSKKIRDLIIDVGLIKIRPIIMTTATTIFALFAVMFSTGTGSEVMKPIAAPIVGGMATATIANLILIPVLFCYIQERRS